MRAARGKLVAELSDAAQDMLLRAEKPRLGGPCGAGAAEVEAELYDNGYVGSSGGLTRKGLQAHFLIAHRKGWYDS